eukprot:5194284-Karenia_brevis.AAC.1
MTGFRLQIIAKPAKRLGQTFKLLTMMGLPARLSRLSLNRIPQGAVGILVPLKNLSLIHI